MLSPRPVTETVQSKPRIYRVTVLESHGETSTTNSIRLSKPGGFSFRASQFARLYLETERGLEFRSMSIASSPTREYLEFAIRRSPSGFKRAFASLRESDQALLAGPFGHFLLDAERPAIMLAGGIGITPMKSIIEFATDTGLPISIVLVYSNRSPEEILFKEELDALAGKNPYLELIYTLTSESSDDQWRGRRGRINLDLLRQVSEARPEAMYYIAGAPRMVSDLMDMLLQIPVPPERIMQEIFLGYGWRPEL